MTEMWPVDSTPLRMSAWSLGVMRKHWGASSRQLSSTMNSNTAFSYAASIPWLISSTTRSGTLDSLWSARMKHMVETEHSPPDCCLPLSAASSVSCLNLTRICRPYFSKSSSPAASLNSSSRTSPTLRMRLKKSEKTSLASLTSSRRPMRPSAPSSHSAFLASTILLPCSLIFSHSRSFLFTSASKFATFTSSRLTSSVCPRSSNSPRYSSSCWSSSSRLFGVSLNVAWTSADASFPFSASLACS
mmetsp:Transcript_63530/g.145546  ORF Transcript_63530/g.145546 Transcript_63530/m.145546 type:complete len:245 (+) Transcript_63530:233-967(+)